MRSCTWVAFLLLTACQRGPAVPTAPVAEPAGAPDLAAPIVAPMVARERLLHDLDRQQQAARARAATMDEAADTDR